MKKSRPHYENNRRIFKNSTKKNRNELESTILFIIKLQRNKTLMTSVSVYSDTPKDLGTL